MTSTAVTDFVFIREDYETAESLETEEKKDEFYVRIKSGAETGWDFSSRWFITANGSDRGKNNAPVFFFSFILNRQFFPKRQSKCNSQANCRTFKLRKSYRSI